MDGEDVGESGVETRQIIKIKRKNTIEDPPEYGQEKQ